MDQYQSPFNVGLGVAVTGTVTYSVQHSFDDVYASNYNPATATWFTHPDVSGETTNADANYAFPVAAIRLAVTAGTGTATLTVLEAGLTG